MNAPLSPSRLRSGATAFPITAPPVPSGQASLKWGALQDAGKVVGLLAGMPVDQPTAAIRSFPALLRELDPVRRERAERGIADLAAVMEPGLAALLAVRARGADPAAPARALWREFRDARAALLALLPPSGALGPRRSA